MNNKLIISLAIGIIFFILANMLLFQELSSGRQGDNDFVQYNTEKHTYNTILSIKEKYIVDFTFFSINDTRYFGYIEGAMTLRQPTLYYFNFINLSTGNETTVKIDFCKTQCFVVGLSLITVENETRFVTITQKEDYDEIEIIHFTLDGKIITKIPILHDTNYFNPNDIYSNNDNYVLTVGNISEHNSEPYSTVVFLNSTGDLVNSIYFGIDQVDTVALSSDGKTLYTITANEKKITVRDELGKKNDIIKVDNYPSNILILNSTNIIIQFYQNPAFGKPVKYFFYTTSDDEFVYLIHIYSGIIFSFVYVTLTVFENKTRKPYQYARIR